MASVSAVAQDVLNQDWILDSRQSHIYVQTEKLENVIEKHEFKAIEGTIGGNGIATVRIDLNSLDTGIDLRNVRMRFLLFETFRFPVAEITAQLDKGKLAELATRSRLTYPLKMRVDLHGMVSEFETQVSLARTGPTTVSVATINPIVVLSDTFGFTKNIGKLSDAMGGIRIVPQAAITFDLVFGTGNLAPELEAARKSREKSNAVEATRAITADECETRFSVMSQTGAIYFKTGSAELDRDSEPLLNSSADIANRCPAVRFDVTGHTDSIGSKGFNQKLSEQRAQSVVDYMVSKGVGASRVVTAGYGDTRPVAPNTNEANRAKNRRIEFIVRKQ